MKDSTLIKGINRPVHSIRLEIQSLRAIAIIAVLFFHLWTSYFKNGYLGVDIFFVISGYLMCLLTFRKPEFSLNTVSDFYFRRLKRIVPTYLLILNVVLLFVILYGSPFDYPFILREITPSAFFYSNSPSAHQRSYFDADSKYSIFLHTWSLSTELQFYIIVPLFFIFIIILNSIHPILKFVFIFLMIIYSFLKQCFAAEMDGRHMALNSRLWQFFMGFLAHFMHESEFIQVKLKSEFKLFDYKTNFKLSSIFLNACLITLISILCSNFLKFQQLNRIAISLLTSLTIALPIQENSFLFLKNSFLVELGGISYSIYLVHWPLFVGHRTLNVDLYSMNKEPNITIGLTLILLSLLFGYLVEKGMTYLFRNVRSWTVLLLFMATAYAYIGMSYYYLLANSPKPPEFNAEMEHKIFNEIVDIWGKQRNHTSIDLTNEEALKLNEKMSTYVPNRGYVLSMCENQTKQLPSNYQINPILIHSACHEKGTGNKTMVLFGNSHAIFSHHGIAHQFRDVYSELSTVFQFACVPLPKRQQQMSLSDEGKQRCVDLMDEIIKVLRGWNKPIDILVILFGYNGMDDPAGNNHLVSLDEGFMWMQSFYSQLNEIAREVLFLPMLNIYFSFLPVRAVQTRLLNGESVEFVGDSRSKIESFMPNARRHLKMIKCERCIRVDWKNLWCEGGSDGLCRLVDKQTKLLYFIDDHHCSLYGSFFVGDYLRKLYIEYINDSGMIE